LPTSTFQEPRQALPGNQPAAGRQGADALLAVASAAGGRRFVAQSFASLRYAREGGPVKSEDDPPDPRRSPLPA